DPLAYGRTERHPLPAPVLGHSDYQADPAFDEEREWLLARLTPGVPGPRTREDDGPAGPSPHEDPPQGASGRSSA
ncbi:hypothetical protein ABZS63_42570, partial [Streptomyces sp. NPDC005568]